jgi:hypothetical protein
MPDVRKDGFLTNFFLTNFLQNIITDTKMIIMFYVLLKIKIMEKMKKFLSAADKAQILMLVLQRGQTESLKAMLQDDYSLTLQLFEALCRLGEDDLLKWIAENCPEAEAYKELYIKRFGPAETDCLFAHLQQKIELENIRKFADEDKKFTELLAQEAISDEVVKTAVQLNRIKEVIERYGQEATYPILNKMKDSTGHAIVAADYFTLDFLCRHKNFVAFQRVINAKAYPSLDAFLSGMLKYDGAVEAMIFTNDEDVQRWLIEHGYRDVFIKQGAFVALYRLGELQFEAWKKWYETSFMEAERLLKHQKAHERLDDKTRKQIAWFLIRRGNLSNIRFLFD